jgi:hypothetical protein
MTLVTPTNMNVVIDSKRPQAATALIAGTIVLSAIGMLTSTVPLLVLASGATLCLVVLLLWRGDDPPILLLPALFQWTEVAIVPLSTMWLKVPLAELSTYGADLEKSSLYGLLGISSLSIGMFLGSGKSAAPTFSSRLREEAMRWTPTQVIGTSLALIGIGYGLAFLSGVAGPAREPLNQAANIKYIGIFLLAYWSLVRGRNYGILLIVVGFEIGFGMTGFFAEFKNTILTFFVAAISAKPRLKAADVLVVSAAAGIVLAVGIFWSAVKPDYREFVNQGTGAQIVSVPIGDRIDFLTNAALEFDSEKVAHGFQRLVARHGYVEFLGLVMGYIPSAMPTEGGKITAAVFRHIAVPRFLWPQKPALPSDTEVMSKYTGLPMVWNSDTSISIGYLGELYADFGYLGGLLGALVIGLVVGLSYKLVRTRFAGSAIICAGLCLMVALPIAYFGTAYVKMVGAFVMTSVVVVLIGQFVLPVILPKLATADDLKGRPRVARLRARV